MCASGAALDEPKSVTAVIQTLCTYWKEWIALTGDDGGAGSISDVNLSHTLVRILRLGAYFIGPSEGQPSLFGMQFSFNHPVWILSPRLRGPVLGSCRAGGANPPVAHFDP